MALVKVLNGYENAIENAADRYEPSIIAKVIALGSQQSRWNDAKWAGDIILPLAFFNYIII